MRRLIRMLAVLAVGAALSLAPLTAGQAYEVAVCNERDAKRQQVTDSLERQATYVEHDTTTEAGTAVDAIYHLPRRYGTPDDQGHGRIIPVDNGGPHASESAYSPFNVHGYMYAADMAVLHWKSDPCSGADRYAFAIHVHCFFTDQMIYTPCNFNAYPTLERQGALSSTWTRPWGLAHKHATGRTHCYDEGGEHPVTDGSAWLRTWLWLDVYFQATGTPATARKSTSKELFASGEPHSVTNGVCWPDWCSAGPEPSGIPQTAFDSCFG